MELARMIKIIQIGYFVLNVLKQRGQGQAITLKDAIEIGVLSAHKAGFLINDPGFDCPFNLTKFVANLNFTQVDS